MSKTTGCILKTFMWIVGIGSLVYGIYFLLTDTSMWPAVQAEVVSCKPVTSDDLGDTTYNTEIEYEVDGVKYSGYFNDYTEYAKGERITVYYDPKSPSSTITSQGEMGFLGCVGALFGLFTIGSMAWGAIKSRKQADASTTDPNTTD